MANRKKTTETENQTKAKKPVELTGQEMEEVQGGQGVIESLSIKYTMFLPRSGNSRTD